MSKYTIPLSKIATEFSLENIVIPKNYEDIQITTPEVNRPGLALGGYYQRFENARIQIIGNAEIHYLRSLGEEESAKRMAALVNARPVAIVLTSGHAVPPVLEESCREVGVPLFRSNEQTSPLMAALIASLNVHLAPRVTRHGVLVEVYGEGVLILGDSGVGKSETAIELVKRGHRLIADDAVEIKRVSSKALVGSTASSSLHSRIRACSLVSPGSTLPPTNSHRRPRALCAGRWQIMNFSPCQMRAATTSVIIISISVIK